MVPWEELGHLSRDRAVSPTKRPGLGFLVSTLFPNKEMEGKDGDGPCISDWSGYSNHGKLTKEQIDYANLDGYATRKLYQRLMQIMQPRVQARIRIRDVQPGLAVTVYSDGWRTRVAEGRLTGVTVGSVSVVMEIDLSNESSIHSPGAYARVVNEQGSFLVRQTIASLCNRRDGDGNVNLSPVTI